MPHQPTSPPGPRFFGRVYAFDCECPRCGQLIIARDQSRSEARLRKQMYKKLKGHTSYNPVLSRVRCGGCGRIFGVGLLFWPVKRPGGRARKPALLPEDHKPNRRQLAMLRQYSHGIWAEAITRQGDSLNVAVDLECSCPEEEGGWAPACPVHGWAQVEKEQARINAEPREEEEEKQKDTEEDED